MEESLNCTNQTHKLMKTFKRRFFSGALNHCYQNTVNGFLLFYNVTDYLVYFTIFCTCAVKHDVHVLSMCQMPDHTHSGVQCVEKEQLSLFYQDVTSLYSRSDAIQCNREGSLFNRPFGSAPKKDRKKAKSILIYIGNNPVERELCGAAIEYRWNYLAYANSDHPFSEKLIVRRASWPMRKALRVVKSHHNRNKPLSYKLLHNLFSSLSRKEGLQLIDYIVTTYSVIDYKYTAKLFGGFDNMTVAMASTTGSDYDIAEVFTGKTDECYEKITRWLFSRLNIEDSHKIFSYSLSARTALMNETIRILKVNPKQAGKYFRIPIKEKKP